MTKRYWSSLLFLSGVVSGCDSGSASRAEEECPEFFICEPQGLPYVRAILPSTNSWGPGADPPSAGETTATVTQPEPGRVCMAGTVEDGWAWLTLVFANIDGNGVSDALDAPGRGIASLEFVLESPPPVGVGVQLVSAVPDCTEGPVACQHWGFSLSGESAGTLFRASESGLVRAPLSAFVKTAGADPSWEFDPSHLSTLQIGPGAFGDVTSAYDFCVSNLRFLDAQGEDVSPTG
jgi:hypothetical protein